MSSVQQEHQPNGHPQAHPNPQQLPNSLQSAAGLNLDHPDQPQQPQLPQAPQQQPTHRVEIQVGSFIYSVHMHRYEQSMLILAMLCIVWNCLVVASVLMSIFDNVTIDTLSNSHIQVLWMVPLVAASLSTLFLSLLAIRHREIGGIMVTGTVICSFVYLTLATFFYGFDVRYQWTIALIYAVTETFIAFIALQKKKMVFFVALFGLTPILISVKVDRHLQGVPWSYIMVIPILTAIGLAILGITYVLIGVKQYSSNSAPTKIYGALFNGFNLIGIFLLILSIALRVTTLTNIIGIAAPTAVYGTLLIILLVCPFQDEISLYNAGAEVFSVMQSPQTVELIKEDSETTFYKISEQWVSTQIPENWSLQQDMIRGQCTICLNHIVELVWMPCGHLSVCLTCGQYLLKKAKLQCVICKTKCKEAYHLPTDGMTADYMIKVKVSGS